MASVFLRPVLRPHTFGLGMGLSSFATFAMLKQQPLRMDSRMLSSGPQRPEAKTPILKNGQLNPRAVRQITSGSITGLVAGLAVSTFSKPLTLLIGLFIIAIQWAAGHGINVLPYDRLQRYVTSINLRSAFQDNVAFKLSFGMTFAMTAFMQF